MRSSLRSFVGGAACVALLAVTMAVPASGTSTPPGLTAQQVTLGAIVTQSGTLAPSFRPYLDGVQAYINYVNNGLHGINGRKLSLPTSNTLDDASQLTDNISNARQLVTVNHVFAIVGVSTAFFGAANYLSTSGVPTFGYATTPVWAGPKNLFADYGSVVDYKSTVPDFAYIAKKTYSTKVALLALNYGPSKDICQPALNTLQSSFGIKVVYSNLNENLINPVFSADVTNMKSAGVNLIVSCMDASSNIALSKAIQQGAWSMPNQIWLDGYDRNLLSKNPGYMNKVYLLVQHVPFEAATLYPAAFPGLNLYEKWMKSSGHSSTMFSDVALMGWSSANLFAMGLKAAGKNPTQASVIADINKITKDVSGPSGGVGAPTNWTLAHTKSTPPSCVTVVTTTGTNTSKPAFKMVFNKTSHPWLCFPLTGTINLNAPVHAPSGTPGA